jgi:hypothetical protein
MVVALSLIAAIGSALPFLVGFSVPSPTPAFSGNPFSLLFQITNDNPLPVFDVQYVCTLVDLRFFPKGGWSDNRSIPAQVGRALWWRQTMTARCEHSVAIGGMPVTTADYSLDVRYLPFPWLWHCHAAYPFTAVVDQNHQIAKWVPK